MKAQILKFASSPASNYRKADLIHSIITVLNTTKFHLLVPPAIDEGTDELVTFTE